MIYHCLDNGSMHICWLAINLSKASISLNHINQIIQEVSFYYVSLISPHKLIWLCLRRLLLDVIQILLSMSVINKQDGLLFILFFWNWRTASVNLAHISWRLIFINFSLIDQTTCMPKQGKLNCLQMQPITHLNDTKSSCNSHLRRKHRIV